MKLLGNSVSRDNREHFFFFGGGGVIEKFGGSVRADLSKVKLFDGICHV